MLTHGRKGFKPSVFSNEEHRAIEKKLHQSENALKGYKELQSWIREEFGKDVKYNTVLKYSMKNFNSSVKVARKSHVLKDAQAVENLKKNFSRNCEEICRQKGQNFKKVNLYFQDESRFGLFTKTGRALTARGVKPVCPFQQKFQSTYLFGAFSPIDGNSFLLEMPHCNSDNFQIFLEGLSASRTEDLKIIVLDNGAFHKAKRLQIPQDIVLYFLPPYSPELNPAEKIWAKFKRDFTNKYFQELDALSDFLEAICRSLTQD